MSTEHLVRMTDEQRQQAKEKREAAQLWAKCNLKDDFSDETFWRALSSDYGVRLPLRHVPGSELKYLKRACKKLNVEVNDFLVSTGFSTLKHFSQANDKWPSWALVGLILEFVHDNKINDYKYPVKIDPKGTLTESFG